MSSINDIITSSNGELVYQQNAKLPSGSLKSIDFITLVDVFSEGEIEGSATASKIGETDKTSTAYKNCFLKDLFLNSQPVLQSIADVNNPADEHFNYNSVDFQFQHGTANNTVLPGADLPPVPGNEITSGEVGEIVTFPQNGQVTERSVTINRVDVDIVRVRVKFNSFFRISSSSGNRKATTVNVVIKITPTNGPQQTITDTVQGKSNSSYSRDYGIKVAELNGYNQTPIGQSGAFFPITVTLSRTNDEGDTNTFNQMVLGGVTQIFKEQNNYPHVAYGSMRFSAEEFPSLPSRVVRVRGKKVKIPGPYIDGDGITYTPTVDSSNGRIIYPEGYIFQGTFASEKKWTSDPAWILYDLLILQEDRITRDSNNNIIDNQQYGCALPEASIDKQNLYTISKYCSQIITNEQNEDEPRFSLNVNIREQKEAMNLIKDICSVMRAMPFYSEGTIKISQDAPKDIIDTTKLEFDYVFNNANVVDGNFVYSGSSLKTRFSVINVSYLDLTTQQLDYVTVKDQTAIDKYGTHVKTLQTFGTTSRSQAKRVGEWFLNTQQNATETCAFETNIAAGSVVQVGNIIGIADRVKGSSIISGTNIVGKRRGGLVKAVSSSQGNSNIDQITIDDAGATNLPDTSDNAKISCLLPNGTVETKSIIDYVSGNIIKISGNFTSPPVLNSPFILESGTFDVTSWKIINIKETVKKTYAISALKHNQNKYSQVETGVDLPEKSTNLLTSILLPPAGLTLEEKIVVINNRAVPKVFIDWQAVDGASGYILQYRRDGDEFKRVNTQVATFEITQSEFEAGTYDIRLFTVNALGQKSNNPTEKSFTVDGLSDPPEQPTSFEIEPINNYQVRLSWDKAIALDVIHGGRCLIRHSTATLASTTFSNSIDLDTSNGNTTEVVVPALEGTYSIKFEDLAGNLSENEAKVEFALPETEDELQLKKFDTGTSQLVDFREQTAFSGTRTRTGVTSGALQLSSPSSTIQGTYSQTGTDLIVSINSHNLIVGDKPKLTFTSGLALNDSYAITSVAADGNSFTVKNTPINNETESTSGNVTVARGLLGRYEFASVLDLGAVYQNVRLKRHIKSEGFNISDSFDDIPNLNERQNFDGAAVDRLKGRLKLSTSNDNSTYTNFINLRNGSFVGRYFKFRSDLISIDINENIKFLELGFDVSLPSRTENKYISSGDVVSTPISSGTSANGFDVVFANRFFTGTSDIGGTTIKYLPSISITPINMPQGARFVIKEDANGNMLNAANQNVNGTGFNIIFYNDSDQPISVKFTFQALGYGKGA